MQPVAPGLSRGMPPLQAVPDEHLGYPLVLEALTWGAAARPQLAC